MPTLVLETNLKVAKCDSICGGAYPLSACSLPIRGRLFWRSPRYSTFRTFFGLEVGDLSMA